MEKGSFSEQLFLQNAKNVYNNDQYVFQIGQI